MKEWLCFGKSKGKRKQVNCSTLEMNVVVYDGFNKHPPFFTNESCADLSRFGLYQQALIELCECTAKKSRC